MKLAVSAAAMAVMSLLLGYVVHVLLLGADYASMTSLFRTHDDQGGHLPAMLVAHALIGIGFAWIYLKGREDKPWLSQGVRFGLAVAVLSTIPGYFIYYAVQPIPGAVVAKQIVFDTIAVLLMGIVCAWINRTRPAT